MKNGTTYNHLSNVATSLIERLKPTFLTKLISRFRASHLLDVLPSDSNSKTVCDYIHLSLPFNQLQYLIVERILDYAIGNKKKIYLESNQQLLIYARGEGEIRKSKIVKAIEMGFALLEKRNELVISVLTGSAANKIGGSTVYTSIEVNT